MGLIMHKGVAYGGGGSDIEPNPSGTATEDLTKLGIDDTNYNVADADYRSDQKTYTFKVYDTNTHKYGSSSVGSTTTIRGVISAISALFDSVKTAINDHADVFASISTAISNINTALNGKADTTNATYTKLTGSGHRFGDIDISQSAPFTSSDVSTIENANMAKIKTIVNNLADYAEENAGDVASTQTATGNPLTLSGVAPINAEKLEVVMEPKQDLHGQSYPYVGGAGKNKLSLPNSNAYMTVADDGWITVNGTVTANVNADVAVDLKQGETYTLSANNETANSGVRLRILGNAGAYDKSAYLSVANAVATWTLEVDVTIFRITLQPATYTNFKMRLQMELGSTASAWQPYSNICPISGYDSVSVERVGFNVFDEVMETGLLQSDGSVSSAYTTRLTSSFIEVLPDTDYYYSNDYILSGRCAYYDENKTCIAAYTSGFQTKINRTPSNAHYVRFSPTSSYGAVYNHDICVKISKPTGTPKNGDYLPYQSTAASITFGQTVYGGKSDFVEGGTKKTRVVSSGKVTSLTAYTYSNIVYGKFQKPTDSANYGNTDVHNLISSMYEVASSISNWDDPNKIGKMFVGADRNNYWIGFPLGTTLDEMKTITNDNVICYELATPTTLATPIAPLKLLENTNNLSTDGTTITIGYQPDNVIGELKADLENAVQKSEMGWRLAYILTDGQELTLDETKYDEMMLCIFSSNTFRQSNIYPTDSLGISRYWVYGESVSSSMYAYVSADRTVVIHNAGYLYVYVRG